MSTPANTSTNWTKFHDRRSTNLKGLEPPGGKMKLPSAPDKSNPKMTSSEKSKRFYHHYHETQNPWIKMAGGDNMDGLGKYLKHVFPVIATRQKAIFTIAKVNDQQVKESWAYAEGTKKKAYKPKFPVYFWGYGLKGGAYWSRTLVDVRNAVRDSIRRGSMLRRAVPVDTPEVDVWPAILHQAYRNFVETLGKKPDNVQDVFCHFFGVPASWFKFSKTNESEEKNAQNFAILSRYAENPDYLPVGFTKDAFAGLPENIQPASCYAISTRTDSKHNRYFDVLVHCDKGGKPYIGLTWAEFLKSFDTVLVYDIHIRDKSKMDLKSESGKYEIWKKESFKSNTSFLLTAAIEPRAPVKYYNLEHGKSKTAPQTYRITVIPKKFTEVEGRVTLTKDVSDKLNEEKAIDMNAGKTFRLLKPMTDGAKVWIKPHRADGGEYLLHIKADDDTTEFKVETCDPDIVDDDDDD